MDVYHLRCSYGNVRTHTLLGEKKHGPEHRWGVCCRGNIADHGYYRCEAIIVKRLWGTPLGVVEAYSGRSGAPPVTPVSPNRCPCAVLLSTGRGVLHLAREGPTARFRHDGGTYWK